MKNLRKLKIALGAVKLEKYVTTDGTDIEVGDDMLTDAPAGTYTLVDGSTLVVAEDGTVTITAPVKDDENLADVPDSVMQPILDQIKALTDRIAELEKSLMDEKTAKDAKDAELSEANTKLAAAEKTADERIKLKSNTGDVKLSKADAAVAQLNKYLN